MVQRTFAVLLGMVSAILLVEVGARAIAIARGKPYESSSVYAGLERVDGFARGELVPGAGIKQDKQDEQDGDAEESFYIHPYLGWEEVPSGVGLLRVLDAFRSGALDRDFVVLVVGGSVAGIFGSPSGGGTEALIAGIAAAPALAGQKVRIIGQGRGAYKQPQQLFLVEWLFSLGVLPDLVINLDGFNELALGNQNLEYKNHPFFPAYPQWGPRLGDAVQFGETKYRDQAIVARYELGSFVSRALRMGVHHSAILGPLCLDNAMGRFQRWQQVASRWLAPDDPANARRRALLLGPKFTGDIKALVDLVVANWSACSRDLAAVCARRGIEYVHVLQPTLHDQGSKPLTELEIERGTAINSWREAIAVGYDPLREEGRRLAASGIHFFDASRVFAEETESFYFDACHFGRHANEILAERVGAFIREAVLAGK